MLDPQAGDEDREKVASDTKGRLESQGTLNHEANWGLRKMAYEIERRGEADYRFYRFTGEKPLLDDLNHSLRITEGVLRFRIFRVEPDAPIIVPPDTEQIMRRDEDDERGGRGGRGGRRDDRGDRGPRRPREESAPAETSAAPSAAAAAPTEAAAAPAAPAAPAETPAPAEAPAPEAPAPEAPAEAPAEATPGE